MQMIVKVDLLAHIIFSQDLTVIPWIAGFFPEVCAGKVCGFLGLH